MVVYTLFYWLQVSIVYKRRSDDTPRTHGIPASASMYAMLHTTYICAHACTPAKLIVQEVVAGSTAAEDASKVKRQCTRSSTKINVRNWKEVNVS